ncbi:MAG: disulfide bond formation protein DsbA, partial [Nitrosopumilales archaeon CG11_big_fil_rev_8_21_14_0_20_33_24]
MGKNKQEPMKIKTKSNKTKFIIIGAIIVIAIGLSVISTNTSTQEDNPIKPISIDTTKGSPILGSELAQV